MFVFKGTSRKWDVLKRVTAKNGHVPVCVKGKAGRNNEKHWGSDQKKMEA